MLGAVKAELDRLAAAGRRASFWLRDDDAIALTPGIERLIDLAGEWDVPVVLAVIAKMAEPGLAARIGELPHVRVAVHGFAHANHAPPDQKKQELGLHRPAATVFEELRDGLSRLAALYSARLLPMLVPPWNRIADELVPGLPALGFRYLSSYGREPSREPAPGLFQINCHLDIIDWRGSRGCLPHELLADHLARLLRHSEGPAIGPIGILTHHLVHDEPAWRFLAALFRTVARHDASAWRWPHDAITQGPPGPAGESD